MLADKLTAFARTVSKHEFCKRYPSPFLLIQLPRKGDLADDEQLEDTEKPPKRAEQAIEFHTDMGMEPASNFEPTVRGNLLVPIAKRGSNPYPDRISIGRARNCDIVVRDHTVSKLHAHFHVRDAGVFELVDFGSHNGTLVNGVRLQEHVGVRVVVGDQIQVGLVLAELVDAAHAYGLLQG